MGKGVKIHSDADVSSTRGCRQTRSSSYSRKAAFVARTDERPEDFARKRCRDELTALSQVSTRPRKDHQTIDGELRACSAVCCYTGGRLPFDCGNTPKETDRRWQHSSIRICDGIEKKTFY